MSDVTGKNITITLFGESHGPAIGCILDGIPAGNKVDETKIEADMDKRRAKGRISTQRHETDKVTILSGIKDGYTTGTAIAILIENQAQNSKDYTQLQYRLRPGHADFTAWEKYHGFQDFRGGGHFSGRLTAPIVAAGSICRQILESEGIQIFSHLKNVHDIEDRTIDFASLESEKHLADQLDLAVLDEAKRAQIQTCIEQAASCGDSVGGQLETVIFGLPAGIGSPFFGSVESVLSALLFSIPAVKSVEFGIGTRFASLYGSEANDPFIRTDGHIATRTNNNGGINGGITNGMPVVFQITVKPTPSIYKMQDSVDYRTKEEVRLQIQGRHDPCIIHRARIVTENIAAFGILDMYLEWKGEQSLCKSK